MEILKSKSYVILLCFSCMFPSPRQGAAMGNSDRLQTGDQLQLRGGACHFVFITRCTAIKARPSDLRSSF